MRKQRKMVPLYSGKRFMVQVTTPVVKLLTFKLIIPNMAVETTRCRPAKGNYYTSANIDKALGDFANVLEKRFPKLEFRLVACADYQWNFIATGAKENAER